MGGFTKLDSVYKKLDDSTYVTGVFYRSKRNVYVEYSMTLSILEEINKGMKEAVLIFNANQSPRAKQALWQMTACKPQIWKEEELMVNPTEHVLTPSHRCLNLDEEYEVVRAITEVVGDIPTKKEMESAKENIPKLLQSDIIVKWYRFPVGSIIELNCDYSVCRGVERNCVKYRVVV